MGTESLNQTVVKPIEIRISSGDNPIKWTCLNGVNCET